ncbi:MAG: NAD+ synthase [Arenicellales bacterium]|nr:NAD+ synthase [Arenicellales bacterium]
MLSIALAQLNLTVGDIETNTARIIETARKAGDRGCQLVVFPELSVTGYPPEDLLLRPAFIEKSEHAVTTIVKAVNDVAIILGYPLKKDDRLFNVASFIGNGAIQATYAKQHLPNYSVFDEKRYFAAGDSPCVVDFEQSRIGITICEDIWEHGPVEDSVRAGADIVININASPFHVDDVDRSQQRLEIVSSRARALAIPIVYINQVGLQDELVFDGASFVVDAAGDLTQRGVYFDEQLMVVDFDFSPKPVPRAADIQALSSLEQGIYQALVLGVRDYVLKNGFERGVVIGLSGGIDSALTLAVAVDALGADKVTAVLMPSRYTLEMSVEDAKQEAEYLGVEYQVIPIEPMFQSFLDGLADVFEGLAHDETEENLQARCRGIILMALSNKFSKMVLATGNKSEMAVGYATLYGDMAGGFAVIKDVPKTMVYRLARYRNSIDKVIPERVISRPPSAELKEDQRDEDSLPAYEILDPILERYIELDQSPGQIVAAGFDQNDVYRVANMVDRNEYKRRQAPPGVRITKRAFGRDRRYPITSGYRPGQSG